MNISEVKVNAAVLVPDADLIAKLANCVFVSVAPVIFQFKGTRAAARFVPQVAATVAVPTATSALHEDKSFVLAGTIKVDV